MKRLASYLLPLAFLVLEGCASMPKTVFPRRVDPDAATTLDPGEVLIFGRILFIENGKDKAPYGLGKPLWQLASVEPTPAAKADAPVQRIIPFLSTRKDGLFAYIIPAGHYEMTDVAPFYYLPTIDPALEFDASEPGRTYCLGDLELDIDTSVWLGGLWGNYITHLNHLDVLDRCEQALAEIHAGNLDPEPARKALLVRIHGRSAELKSRGTGGILVAPAGLRFGR